MIGSEALPFAKTGGLADVLGALPQALGRLGWNATVVIPRYRGVEAGKALGTIDVVVGGRAHRAFLSEAPIGDGARVVLVDEPDLFDREHLYGVGSADYADNPRRFAVLTRVALEWVARQPMRKVVLHAHDWQAGLTAAYAHTLYASHPIVGQAPTIFTIHNLAYQGNFDPSWMPQLDLPWSLYTPDQLEYWNRLSFLKAGIVSADVVTTVSPQYAREIQTAEGGIGFHGVLQSNAGKLRGILNGIDAQQWNPATDPHLPAHYDVNDLTGKRAAKRALLAAYSLPEDGEHLERPLVGMISRMVAQKGLDLIEALAGELPKLDASFVILGTGEPRYQDMWRQMASEHPDRIAVRVGFSEPLAHLIEAGADMFLMPSMFEPCGLNQMYSLRYGTLPIVRRVGGLADTVTDPQDDASQGNGFVFSDYSPWALLSTIKRALDTFKDQAAWRGLQRTGMAQDLSWDRSAREYVKIYDQALTKGRP